MNTFTSVEFYYDLPVDELIAVAKEVAEETKKAEAWAKRK